MVTAGGWTRAVDDDYRLTLLRTPVACLAQETRLFRIAVSRQVSATKCCRSSTTIAKATEKNDRLPSVANTPICGQTVGSWVTLYVLPVPHHEAS
jgi:hypothetical protein